MVSSTTNNTTQVKSKSAFKKRVECKEQVRARIQSPKRAAAARSVFYREPSREEVEVRLRAYNKRRQEETERLQARLQSIKQAAAARSIKCILTTDYERPNLIDPQNPTNQDMIDHIEKASRMLDDEVRWKNASWDSIMAAINGPSAGPALIPSDD